MSRAGASGGPAARTRATRAVVERFAALHAAGDVAGCRRLLAPAVVGQSPWVASNLELDGYDAVAALLEGTAALWAERRETIAAVGAGPDAGWFESRLQGTAAASGEPVELDVVTVLGVDADGHVTSVRAYGDTTPFGLPAGGSPPLITGPPAGHGGAAGRPRGATETLIARYFALVGAGEIDAVLACFEEDGSFQPPPAPEPFRGAAAIRAFFEGLVPLFAERHEWTTRVVVDGPLALAELVFEAKRHDGQWVRFENCNVFRLRGGRFGDVRVYGDAAAMRRQLA
mgnify:CR=1 FL=1